MYNTSEYFLELNSETEPEREERKKQKQKLSHVVLPKALTSSAYSAALPILSSDAPYELPLN
jgi:hypothetical protein